MASKLKNKARRFTGQFAALPHTVLKNNDYIGLSNRSKAESQRMIGSMLINLRARTRGLYRPKPGASKVTKSKNAHQNSLFLATPRSKTRIVTFFQIPPFRKLIYIPSKGQSEGVMFWLVA